MVDPPGQRGAGRHVSARRDLSAASAVRRCLGPRRASPSTSTASRANEPFGDIINWDGLPPGAISGINVMAGSNPLFGLNALGGAVSVRTRDGFTSQGSRLSLSGGSFDRYRGDGEAAVMRNGLGRLSWSGSFLDESGWRNFFALDASSSLRQGQLAQRDVGRRPGPDRGQQRPPGQRHRAGTAAGREPDRRVHAPQSHRQRSRGVHGAIRSVRDADAPPRNDGVPAPRPHRHPQRRRR